MVKYTSVLKVRSKSCFGTQEDCTFTTYSILAGDDNSYRCRVGKGLVKLTECPADAAKVELILARIGALTLPLSPERPMGCDGGITEIELGDSWCGARLSWWSDPPAGWEELDAIAWDVIHLCKQSH